MKYTREPNRVFAENEKGNFMAEVTFPEYEEDIVTIDHTYVDPSLRGQGVATELMRHAYEHIKANGKKARATCPYAISWFRRNPEAKDIFVS